MKILISSLLLALITIGMVLFFLTRDSGEQLAVLSREAHAFLDENELENAKNLREEIRDSGGNPDYAALLSGRIHLFENEPEDARASFERIREPAFEDPVHYYHWTRLAFDLDLTEAARGCLDQYRSLFPGHPGVLKMQALLELNEDEPDFPAVRDLLTRLYEQDYDDAEYKIVLARILRNSTALTDRLKAKVLYREVAEDDLLVGLGALLELAGSSRLPMSRAEQASYFSRVAAHPFFPNPRNGYLYIPEYARPLIDYLLEVNPEAALFAGQRFLQGGQAGFDDALLVARLYLRNGNLEACRRLFEQMEDFPDVSPQNRSRLEILRQLVGPEAGANPVQVTTHPDFEPDDPVIQEFLGQALLSQISELPDSRQADQLPLLANNTSLQPAFRLAVFGRLIDLQPTQEAAWLESASSAMVDFPEVLASWLASREAWNQLLVAIPADLAQDNPVLFENRFRALLRTGQPEAARQLIDLAEPILEDMDRAFYGAALALNQGERDTFRALWQDSFHLSRGSMNLEMLLKLARTAYLAGEMERAYEAIKPCVEAYFLNRAADWHLALALCSSRESPEFLEMLSRRALRQYPEDPAFINNFAYFQIVQEEAVSEHVAVLDQLVTENPDNVNFAMTLALGRVLLGRTEEAMRAVESLSVDWTEQSPSTVAILALVFAASGQQAMADNFLDQTDITALQGYEVALLQPYFPGRSWQ